MPLDSLLLELLVDPTDRGPLWYFADHDVLYNPRAKKVYAVIDLIPVLLPDEGRIIDAAEAAELDAGLDEAIETGTRRT